MKVKNNSLFGMFYNKFDFPIRFFYCRLSFLNKLLFWKLYSSNIEQLDNDFEEMKKSVDLKKKICLELGPGNSLIMAYNCLMSGAKKVILVDKFSRRIKSNKQKEFFYKEIDFIKKKYGEDLFFLKNNKFDQKYIEFIEGDITTLKLNVKVDFVYSISVLEHVKEIMNTVWALSDVLKKNGLMYHNIDLRDHYNFNKPFMFYKYSDKVWNKYLSKEGISYTNRLRYGDYISLFHKHNLKITNVKSSRFPLNKQPALSQFKEKDNDVGIVIFILQPNEYNLK